MKGEGWEERKNISIPQSFYISHIECRQKGDRMVRVECVGNKMKGKTPMVSHAENSD